MHLGKFMLEWQDSFAWPMPHQQHGSNAAMAQGSPSTIGVIEVHQMLHSMLLNQWLAELCTQKERRGPHSPTLPQTPLPMK